MDHVWPLTGRVAELRQIRACGAARGVVLVGPAGVGKTRLAREAVAAAAERGAAARWVAATASARALPLAAFASVVGDVGSERAQLIPRAAAAVVAGAAPDRLLLAVDDAHLLDEFSAILLHHLVQDRHVRVILTLRAGECAPQPVAALSEHELPRLDVQPLAVADTGSLLEAALGGAVDGAAVRRLWTITRGNVLYLRHLVAGEREAGRLRPVNGVWVWTGTPELSPGLVELIRARMGELSPGLSAITDLLAFGEPLAASDLQTLGCTPADLQSAEGRGLVELRLDGRRRQIRLAHPLYGEVRRAATGELHARAVRGRLSAALARTLCRRGDDELRRAALALDSDLAPDVAVFTRAAQRAAVLNAIPLAERLARAALAAGGGFESAMALASVLVGGSARAAEPELLGLSTYARTDEEQVRAAVLQVTSLAFMASRPRVAEVQLAETLARVRDPASRLDLMALGATLDAMSGRVVPAAAAARQVLDAPGAGNRAVAFAGLAAVVSRGVVGRLDGLEAIVVRAVDAATRSPDAAWLAATTLGWHAYVQRLGGDLTATRDGLRAAQERFSGVPGPEITLRVMRGAVELSAGDLPEAIRLLTEARAALVEWGDTVGGWVYACLLHLAPALALAGDLVAARRVQVDLLAAVHPGFPVVRPELTLAQAWIAAAEGSEREALDLGRAAAAEANAAGQAAHEVTALQTCLRLGDATSAPRLAELALQVDGPRAAAAAAHAAALAAADPRALQAVAGDLECAGDLLGAADVAAQCALLQLRTGRGGHQVAAAQAGRLAQACGGARTPALIALATPVPLTAREREVLTLAARGLSNLQIAQRLVLSVRTVEGHRYRGLSKVGTVDLSELADVLGIARPAR